MDTLAGKIDLIVTKSVSRFARNTVDSLSTGRKLKAAEVEIYCEKENIFTMDQKDELMIIIMSSLAQEESRSISENTIWGQRKRIADGIKTVTGKDKWNTSTIISMLKNEKYKGDCLMQKFYIDDFLTKKLVKNNGELQRYYVKDHHEPIVSEEVFDACTDKITK